MHTLSTKTVLSEQDVSIEDVIEMVEYRLYTGRVKDYGMHKLICTEKKLDKIKFCATSYSSKYEQWVTIAKFDKSELLPYAFVKWMKGTPFYIYMPLQGKRKKDIYTIDQYGYKV